MDALRRLGSRRALLPVAARMICARLVYESATFFMREVSRPRRVYVYTVRASGTRVAMRHTGVDAATLAEVFYHRYYEPPDEVARAVGEPHEIIDLGANIGLFGAFAIARWPGTRLVAYEPDPASAAIHERTIVANGLGDRWRLVRAAAGAREGEVRFAAGLEVGSHLLEDENVGTTESSRRGVSGTELKVRLSDVLPQVSGAELVKMDIEGGEWDILQDERFRQNPPRALVLEYHPRRCPGADARVAAESALARAGLRCTPIWHAEDGHGMVWAYRPA